MILISREEALDSLYEYLSNHEKLEVSYNPVTNQDQSIVKQELYNYVYTVTEESLQKLFCYVKDISSEEVYTKILDNRILTLFISKLKNDNSIIVVNKIATKSNDQPLQLTYYAAKKMLQTYVDYMGDTYIIKKKWIYVLTSSRLEWGYVDLINKTTNKQEKTLELSSDLLSKLLGSVIGRNVKIL